MRNFYYKLLITYRTVIYCVLAISLTANYGVYVGKLARSNGVELASACGDSFIAPLQVAARLQEASNAPAPAAAVKKAKRP